MVQPARVLGGGAMDGVLSSKDFFFSFCLGAIAGESWH